MKANFKWKDTPILETERIFLRKFCMEDLADVHSYCSDPKIDRFVTWEAHRTEEDTKKFLNRMLERYKLGEPSDWAIMEKSSGRIIGSIGLIMVDEANASCTIGFALGTAYWNKGYMSEVLGRVVRYLFEECGVNRIQACCCEENVASAHVLEKNGFRFEGLQYEAVRMKERFWNLKMYSLLFSWWENANEPSSEIRDKVIIEEVTEEDLTDVLALQKIAYQSEAAIYGYGIAPLTQTLEDIKASMKELVFLKAVLNGVLVGSIRARIGEGTCFIGRLIVAPEYQHQGIGRRLLNTMEALHSGKRFELFTGHLSTRNIEMYKRLGYSPFKTVRIGDRESLVYLEKFPTRTE